MSLAAGSVVGAVFQSAGAAPGPHEAEQVIDRVTTAVAGPPRLAASKPHGVARAAYKRLSPRERVGQLFMMGVLSTDPSRAAMRGLRDGDAGNAFVYGDDSRGRSDVRQLATRLRRATMHRHVRPFLAVDQEGGRVQRLRGLGFSRIPRALDQGQLAPRTLRDRATTWGRQIRAAGFNLNLAPVADTVPASVGTRNKPIGALYREYAHRPHRVGTHVAAVVRGMGEARVQTAVKHFPGLGRATGNTDRRLRVTDPTRPGGRYLNPYRAGARAGAQFTMVSSAIYPHIDPGTRACFSSRIMRGLLRKQLKFHGIVVSDDLSARSVSWLAPAERTVRFLAAGGTMVLDTAADRLPDMVRAVRAEMRHDHRFAKRIRHDVLRVLRVKARDGLIG